MTLGAARGQFRPPVGLGNRHLQSTFASWRLRRVFIRRRALGMLRASRAEVLHCPDGVRLKGYYSPRAAGAKGLVVLLHGWEGSADSQYVLSCSAGLYDAGFEVFRLNFRDHGDTHELNEELFHSCRIDEVVDGIRRVQELHGTRPMFVVGFSLGGNFALRTAIRAQAAGLELSKVVALCPVLHPHSTMRALESGLWVYRYYFLTKWRRSLLAKARLFPEKYDFGDLRRFSTLTETTDFFVSNYTEFPDLDSYLEGYSIADGVLADLAVPARLIATLDDPVIPSQDLSSLRANDALTTTVLPKGGHCGFLMNYRLESWADERIRSELEVGV